MPLGFPSCQRALVLGVGLAIASPATAAILPPDRLTTWNPGVPGGVPARTTVCATVNASTYGNGLSDATAGIQAALDGCPVGQVVSLSAGNFLITSALQISKGIVLRGQGPTQTKLKMPVGTNSNLITVGTQWPSLIQSTNLATDAVKGTQTLTLASNPGLAVGEVVTLDQLTDSSISQWSPASPPGDASRGWFSRFDRPVGQVMEVASVSGTAVTFTTPFHITFKTAFSAQLSRFTDGSGSVIPVVKYGGVEDLYVSGGSQGQGNVWLNSAYSWIRNIESDFQNGKSVALTLAFRCIVRDSYIHSTQDPNPGGGGYGLAVSYYSSDNLIENNIIWNMNKVMVMQASGGGNVIGYNYMEDGWIAASPGFPETGLNASHMTTAHYELFEGNESWNFDGDSYWGNAVYITVFRNHFTGKRRSILPLALTDAANRHAIGIMGGHWWYSFVGNVLGTSGQNPLPFTSFQYEESYPWPDDPIPMWKLGYDQYWGATSADPKVLSTVIRGGNFDYATSSVHWENLTQQTIPSSLYLTGKPGFFGNNPWPWVDPTGATPLSTLPARARFDAGNPNPPTYALSVAKAGTGGGTLTSSPGGINCGASCSASYTAATLVTLTAAPGAGSLFSGWNACSGTGNCQVTMSAAQSVTATFTLSTTPPTVSLTAPLAGQTVSGSITVSATASDVVGVAGVQFKLDGANLGAEVTTSPYSILWATAGVANGAHTLTAVARDTANNTATSSPVTVTVSNAPPPTLSINDVSVTEPNTGTVNAVFTVTLSSASSQTVTVAYATADGTATAGTDYVATAGNLSFSPGTTTQTLTVQVMGDTLPEPNETFFVNLSGPTGATLAKGQGTGTIVDTYVPPARAWQEGTTVFTSHSNCTTGAVEQLTSQHVGYVGTTDVTFPRAGDVYYSRVVVSSVGNACAGPTVHVEVVLPPSTQLEISAGHPVSCFSTSPTGVTTQIVTGCPQALSMGTYGWTLDSADPAHPGPWALPRGASLEIQFPVRSLQKLSGATTNSYLQSYVHALDGASNPWGNSTQPVSVGDKPPGSRLGQGGADFDNDLRADPTVYHQANGLWYVRQSSTESTFSVSLGGTGYTPLSGDFDWDGHADLAVYQQSSGLWFIRKSSTGTTYSYGFGGPGFTPVPADYDGDQQTDFAVYHQASGLWYINKSTTLTTGNVGFGGTGYAPVPKDYDGDGKTDLAVYHQASGLWFIQQSSTGAVTTTGFGGPGFVPVPRDYDGDGKADLAVFHPASGLWYIRPSGGGPDIVQGFGGSAYTPVPADYDGDGKADIAVYHEVSGLWFIKQSTTGTTVSFAYGGTGFTPVNY